MAKLVECLPSKQEAHALSIRCGQEDQVFKVILKYLVSLTLALGLLKQKGRGGVYIVIVTNTEIGDLGKEEFLTK